MTAEEEQRRGSFVSRNFFFGLSAYIQTKLRLRHSVRTRPPKHHLSKLSRGRMPSVLGSARNFVTNGGTLTRISRGDSPICSPLSALITVARLLESLPNFRPKRISYRINICQPSSVSGISCELCPRTAEHILAFAGDTVQKLCPYANFFDPRTA